jgi:hypothetical protein
MDAERYILSWLHENDDMDAMPFTLGHKYQ